MGKRQRVPTGLQRFVFARDGLRCRYCAYESKHTAKFHLDHVVPVSKGGPTNPHNLVVACVRCNLMKGDDVWKPMSRAVCQSVKKSLTTYAVLRSQGMTTREAGQRMRSRAQNMMRKKGEARRHGTAPFGQAAKQPKPGKVKVTRTGQPIILEPPPSWRRTVDPAGTASNEAQVTGLANS